MALCNFKPHQTYWLVSKFPSVSGPKVPRRNLSFSVFSCHVPGFQLDGRARSARKLKMRSAKVVGEDPGAGKGRTPAPRAWTWDRPRLRWIRRCWGAGAALKTATSALRGGIGRLRDGLKIWSWRSAESCVRNVGNWHSVFWLRSSQQGIGSRHQTSVLSHPFSRTTPQASFVLSAPRRS